MRRGLNISELAQKLADQQSQKHDLVASTETIAMTSTGRDLVVPQEPSFGIRRTAHDQIGERLKIPAEDCAADAYHLQSLRAEAFRASIDTSLCCRESRSRWYSR
jgi:hypothetical protein